MNQYQEEQIRRIHQSPWKMVLVLTGGGTQALSNLLTVPGGSQTLLEGLVPYSTQSLSLFLGRTPEQFCSEYTARLLAMASFQRAIELDKCIDNQTGKDSLRNKNKIDNKTNENNNDPNFIRRTRPLLGIGVTASLASDRPKKGAHRIHIATQSERHTAVFSLELQKGKRTRAEEELLTSEIVLNAILHTLELLDRTPQNSTSLDFNTPTSNDSVTNDSVTQDSVTQIQTRQTSLSMNLILKESLEFSFSYPLSLPLFSNEIIVSKTCFASSEWSHLFFETSSEAVQVNAILCQTDTKSSYPSLKEVHNNDKENDKGKNKGDAKKKGAREQRIMETVFINCPSNESESETANHVIFPGSFRPIHEGHLEMAHLAEQATGRPVDFEISVRNVDKAPLDFIETVERYQLIHQAAPEQAVWFTRFPLFVDKSSFFRDRTFIAGTDTIIRIGNPVYHGGTEDSHHYVIQCIKERGAHFLIFTRKVHGKIECLESLPLDTQLKELCQEIPPEEFLDDISSTKIRQQQKDQSL